MRMLFALMVTLALGFCIGCGSSNNTANSVAGNWKATLPVPNTSTPTSAANVTPMAVSFTIQQAGSAPTPTPQAGAVPVADFNPGPADGCFDANAQVTATTSPGANPVLTVLVMENGNQLVMNAVVQPGGSTALGSFNLTGATAGCNSGSGSVSLTRG